MEVTALSKKQILYNLIGYLPITLFAGFIYFVFGSVGLVWLFNGHLPDDLVKPVAVVVTALVVVIAGILYVRFVVNRLAQSRLALEGDEVIVRGQTSRGVVERWYTISDIELIAFGEQLNAAERVMDRLRQLGVPNMRPIGLLKDLKAGRLLVTDQTGHQEVFHFVDKVFDAQSLLMFAVELSKRGVPIGGSV